MRQRLVLVVLVVLAFARPASAELGFFRWWDSLSGPGPFNGVVFDTLFLCHGTKRIPTSGNTATTADAPSYNTFDWNCWNQRHDRLHVNFGVEVGIAKGHNNLPYESGHAPDVTAVPVMATTTVGWHPAYDFGAGIGFVRFSGDGFGFNRFAVESRVTVRPLVLLPVKSELTKRRLEFLELRLFGTGIPGEIAAADFAATGPWRSDAEWLPGFMIVVRIGSLFRPE